MKDYYRLRIKEIIKETDDAVTISFKQPFFGRIRYKCGQFLTLVFNIEGREFRRAYSINSAPGLDDDVSITVKKVPGGVISNYIFQEIKRGDTLLVMRPMGNFVLEADKKMQRNLVLFGAGSGITPLMSILKATLYFEPDSFVTLIYSNKTRQSIIFKEQLDILKERFADRLFIKHLISDENERLNPRAMESYFRSNPFYTKENALFYLCGPEAYMNVVKEGLSHAGISDDQVLNESFTAKKDTAPAKAFDIVFKTKKTEQKIEAPAGKSILDTGLDAGLRMRFACFNGQCGTCKCRCITGSVRMAVDNILTDEEKNNGFILACVGYPASEGVVIELE